MLFISSTYVDLIPERQAVRQALEGVATDVIGGMECFFSEPRESLEVCLDSVARAHAITSEAVTVLGAFLSTLAVAVVVQASSSHGATRSTPRPGTINRR